MMLRRKTVCCQAGGKGGSGKFGQSQLFALIVWHSACGGCSDNIPGEIRRTRCEDIAVAFVSTELHDAARNHVISGIPAIARDTEQTGSQSRDSDMVGAVSNATQTQAVAQSTGTSTQKPTLSGPQSAISRDSVQLSKTAQAMLAAPQEDRETPVQTAKEANEAAAKSVAK